MTHAVKQVSQQRYGGWLKRLGTSVAAVLSLGFIAPIAVQAASVTYAVSSGDPTAANGSFDVDIRLDGNAVGPVGAFGARVEYDEAQVIPTTLTIIADDGFSFDTTDLTANLGAGAASYKNLAGNTAGTNPLNGKFARLTFMKQGVAGAPTYDIIGNPDIVDPLITTSSQPIPATFASSTTLDPADVIYSVDTNTGFPNVPFNVYVRVADNSQVVGAFAFTINYDPTQVMPTGSDATAVAGEPFIYDSLDTQFNFGAVNVLGAISSPGNSSATGYLFKVPFVTTGTPPTSFDTNGVPSGLTVGDNSAVPDPFIESDGSSTEIPHVFSSEIFAGPAPAGAQIHYTITASAVNPGDAFDIKVSIDNNADLVGAFAFSLLFDPSEINITGDAMAVPGSIVYDALNTADAGPGRVNVAGATALAVNSVATGPLFTISAVNVSGAALGSLDGTGIPDNLILVDNPSVTDNLLNIDGDPIAHSFVRDPLVTTPEIELSTTTLTASVTEGLDATPDSFTVRNSGGGVLNYSITVDQPWLSVSPMAGASSGEVDSIDVIYDTDTLTPGNYSANITVTDGGASNSPQVIAVDLTVTAAPNVAQVYYSVDGSALNDGDIFNVVVRIANNPTPIAGFGFSLFYNPAELIPTGLAVDGADFTFDSLDTTDVGGGRLNIAGLISSPTASEGTFFSIQFTNNSGGTLTSTDGTGIPDSLTLGDNPDIVDNLIDASNNPLAHVFLREMFTTIPEIELNTATLSASVQQGLDATPQSFTVRNSGTGTLTYDITVDQPWLSVSPTSGTSTGEVDSIDVNFDTDLLAPGVYNATITVSDPLSSNNPQVIAVDLTVTAIPAGAQVLYSVDASALSDGDVFNLVVRIANNTTPIGAFGFSVFYNPAELIPTGLAVDGSDFTFDSIDTTDVGGGRLNIAGLISSPTVSEGQFFTIQFTNNSGGFIINTDGTGIPDSLTLGDNPDITDNLIDEFSAPIPHVFLREAFVTAPEIELNTTTLNAVADQGTSPANDSFTVRNSGTGTLNYSITDDQTWLSESPSSGTSTGEADSITVTYNTASLAPGNYVATITVSDPGASNNPQNITVNLTVNALPNVAQVLYSVDGSALNDGDVFNVVVTIDNNPTPIGAFGFSLYYDDTQLTPTGLAIDGGDFVFDSLDTTDVGGGRLNIAGLISSPTASEGTFFSIQFMNTSGTTLTSTDGTGIPDSLTLADNPDISDNLIDENNAPIPHVFARQAFLTDPFISVNPTSLTVTATQGTNPPSLAFEVSNTGGGVLTFDITVDQPWLSVTPNSGTAVAGEVVSITADFDTAALAVGVYNATITVADPAATNNPALIPVTLTVNPQPAEIRYYVEGSALNDGDVFLLKARLANNTPLLGAFAFTVTYDPAQLTPTGEAAPVAGSPFNFATFDSTTNTGAGTINVAGAIADPADSASTGLLFQVEFSNTSTGTLTNTDGTGIPDDLTIADNPGVIDNLLDIDSNPIAHVFVREAAPMGNVRFANLSPDAGIIDFYVDGSLVNSLDFESATSFGSFAFGTHTLDFVPEGGILPESLLTTMFNVDVDSSITLVAYDEVANIAALVLTEDYSPLAVDTARLGGAHVATGFGQLDFLNLDSGGNTPLVADVDFGTAGPYTVLSSGDYRVGLDLDDDLVEDYRYTLPTLDGVIVDLLAVNDTTQPNRVILFALYDDGSFQTILPEFTLTTNINPAGGGTIASNPASGANGTYLYGTSVNLTANPNAGFDFVNFSGPVTNVVDNTADVILTSDTTVTANFTPQQVTLTVIIAPPGGGTVELTPAGGTYDFGTEVELDATANPGFRFGSYSGDLTSTNANDSIILDGDKTVTATFIEQFTVTVTINPPGSGSVSLSPAGGVYDAGTDVTLTATPATGFVFQSYTGDLDSTNATDTVTVDSNLNITANFAVQQVTLTVIVAPPASGVVNLNPAGGTYDFGTDVTLTAVPAAGFVFESYSGDLTSTNATETITMNGNKTVTANFRRDSVIEFTFPTDEQGWTFVNSPPFADVDGTYSGVTTTLNLATFENQNSFGFWESPEFIIGDPLAPVVRDNAIVIRGTSGPDSLYRSTWEVFSNQTDPSLAPVLRLRSSAFDFRQSDVLVSTSTQDGSFSPGTVTRTYSQYFSQPDGQDSFRLDFDILNFIADDAADAILCLDSVRVEALGDLPTSAGTPVVSYDFVADGAQGFQQLPAASPFALPQVYDSSNGLLIQGQSSTRGTSDAEQLPAIFGFWGLDSSTAFTGNTLYRVRWAVTSSATSANRAALPTFRGRVNDSTFRFAALTNIESVNDSARVPFDGSVELYDTWFQAPSEIAGNNMVFSFDYLYVDKTGSADVDDPTLSITVNSINVFSYPVPAGK